MDVRQLRYFIAVAEERHFGRAAERLHMAQPPLSQHIRRMEAEIGAPLFHRTTRRVELAPAGEALLERARRLLADLDVAVDDARRAARGEHGKLAIGFTGSATYSVLPAVTAAMRDELPGVHLTLHGEMFTPAQVEALVEGSIDLAILRPPVHRSEIELEIMRRERLIAVLPAHHPLVEQPTVSVGDLADQPLVAYSPHFRSVLHDAVERTCDAHGFMPKVAIEVKETATMIAFVAAGLGVALVPASVAHMRLSGAVYRELQGASVPIELGLAWRRGDDSPVLARALDVVRASVRAAPVPAGVDDVPV
jgi:DNA-binding transcriptional LysR family regulator